MRRYEYRRITRPSAANAPYNQMFRRLIVQTVALVAVMAALLFVPAGTLAWPGAWAFLGEMAAGSVLIGGWLARHDPGLLAERMSGLFQREQPRGDKILMAVFLALVLAWLPLMALDAERYRLSHVPAWLQSIGALALAMLFVASFLVFRANTYAAPAVKLQAQRGHRVVTEGPYAVVRHPMYAAAILYFLGTPLLLGSWWGLAFAPAFIALLAVRAVMEERMLTRALDGYPAYAARVRYRLVPFIW
ncbi:MAG TPA: isoprenylcysteine carboxylmethyltransferase family protein [Xanthobacteraceae bacterium]|nr:isoprenylcysteine carboxylmethyltransferase family protein [Xanthobacteraceae bacterium]